METNIVPGACATRGSLIARRRFELLPALGHGEEHSKQFLLYLRKPTCSIISPKGRRGTTSYVCTLYQKVTSTCPIWNIHITAYLFWNTPLENALSRFHEIMRVLSLQPVFLSPYSFSTTLLCYRCKTNKFVKVFWHLPPSTITWINSELCV